jgi:hypothetical protein
VRKDPDVVVSALVPKLDELRETWIAQVMDRYASTHPIVNRRFGPDIDLGVHEEELPSTFPFNRFDGEAAEALLVNWQVQVVIRFSIERNYFSDEELGEFVGALMKYGQNSTRSSTWLRTFGSFFSTHPLQPEHAGLHFAQYLLGSIRQSAEVSDLGSDLHGFLYILALGTRSVTATCFGDTEEADRCIAEIKAVSTNSTKLDSSVEAVNKKSGCFIATAVYGHSDAEEVRLLRVYRDLILSKTWMGQSIMKIYYRCSPGIADMLMRNDVLRVAVRRGVLVPLVIICRRRLRNCAETDVISAFRNLSGRR